MSTTSSNLSPVSHENPRIGPEAQPRLIQTPSAQPIYSERALTSLEKVGVFSIISSSVAGLLLGGISMVNLVNPLWMLLPLFFTVVGAVIIAKETSSAKETPTFMIVKSITLYPSEVRNNAERRRQRQELQKLKKETQPPQLMKTKQSRQNIVQKNLAARVVIPQSRGEKPLPDFDIEDNTPNDLAAICRGTEITTNAPMSLEEINPFLLTQFAPEEEINLREIRLRMQNL